MSADSYQRIWAKVAEIPHGKVATYGQIAQLAGLGKRARMVGYALHRTPDETRLPWHRVINAQGRIAFPVGDQRYHKQCQLLRDENIVVINGRLDLGQYRWQPEGETLPEEYLNPELEHYELET